MNFMQQKFFEILKKKEEKTFYFHLYAETCLKFNRVYCHEKYSHTGFFPLNPGFCTALHYAVFVIIGFPMKKLSEPWHF